ncbi:MAG: cation:dicarboxylase symporter family transporter [bacterium]
MSLQKQSILIPLMLAGAILGGIAGFFIPEFMLSVSVIGQLFLNLLKIITIPLIISVIIVGIASLGDTRKIGRTTVISVLYFLSTSAIAIMVGIILVTLINPGSVATHAGGYSPDVVSYAKSFQFSDIFKAFIPSNILSSTAGGQYLGIIVLSLIFGTVLATMGRKAKVVLDFFTIITEVSLKAVYGILFIAPIGFFFLVGSAIAGYPESLTELAGNFSMLSLTLLAGLIVHGLIILPAILRVYGRKAPHIYAGNMSSALITAFGTSSSVATMPVTYSCVVEKSGVDSRAGSLVIPMGSFVNLNGTAMFLAIMTIFACQMFGVSLSIPNIIFIGLLSLVLSFCSAGVPGSSIFMMAILFNMMNLPSEAYAALGLLIAVDWLFDRGRTVLNVWGNAVGAAVIGEGFDFKTVSKTKSTAPIKKYERPYDKKPDYKKDKPFKQDRYQSDNKTNETKRPAAKKRERLEPSKSKPYPLNNKKEVVNQKKEVIPEVEKKTEVVKPISRQSSALKPPPIPPAPNRNTLPVEFRSEQASNTATGNKELDSDHLLSNDTIERERARIAAQLASMKEQEKFRPGKENKYKPEPKVDTKTEPDAKDSTAPKIDFYAGDERVDKKEKFFETNNLIEKVKNIKIPEISTEYKIDEETEKSFDSDINDQQEPKHPVVEAPKFESDAEEKLEDDIIDAVYVEDDFEDSEDKTSEISDKEPEKKSNAPFDKKPEDTPEPQFGRSRVRRGAALKAETKSDEKGNQSPTPTSQSVTVVENEESVSFGRSKKRRAGR